MYYTLRTRIPDVRIELIPFSNNTSQKMKFSVKDFFSKCDQIRSKPVTFTEEILNGKLYFSCSVMEGKRLFFEVIISSREYIKCIWCLNDTLSRKNCVLLNSVLEFIEIEAWLLLTFFICLHNQLSSMHSIVTY